MLNQKIKIGDVLFPNKVVSVVESTSNLTRQGYKSNNVPVLTIRVVDESTSNYREMIKALKATPEITVVNPNTGGTIGVISGYPVYGTCDRVLEDSGFNISFTMYDESILELEDGSNS